MFCIVCFTFLGMTLDKKGGRPYAKLTSFAWRAGRMTAGYALRKPTYGVPKSFGLPSSFRRKNVADRALDCAAGSFRAGGLQYACCRYLP